MVNSNQVKNIPQKETKLKGLPHGISADQEEKLWGNYPALRPRHHRERLQHFISLEFGLARLLAGWIPACGHLEWKLELPRLMFEHMQHVRRMRERLEELPGGTGPAEPTPAIQGLFQAIARAEQGPTYIRGYIDLVLPALTQAYQEYIAQCDDILDAPTIYVLRPFVSAHWEMIERGRRLLDKHALPIKDEAAHNDYLRHLRACLDCVDRLRPQGGLRPAEFPPSPVRVAAGPCPESRVQDARLRLREGFPTTKAGNPTNKSLREIIYHDATEWQVIDPMCEIFYGIPKMPLDFFIDFARHTWDECRHSRMGFRRLAELGYDPIKEFEWSHGATRVAVLEEYFAGLTLVGEACSFTRKKGSISLFLKAGDHRSAMLPEVDCVDEQLHVAFGHKWVTEMFKLVQGKDVSKDSIARASRGSTIQWYLSSNVDGDAKRFLEQLDEESRAALVNTFSGFCGAIEFEMDLTAY
jgi:hypothetical protein